MHIAERGPAHGVHVKPLTPPNESRLRRRADEFDGLEPNALVAQPDDGGETLAVGRDGSVVRLGRRQITAPVGGSSRGGCVEFREKKPIHARDQSRGDVTVPGQRLRAG